MEAHECAGNAGEVNGLIVQCLLFACTGLEIEAPFGEIGGTLQKVVPLVPLVRRSKPYELGISIHSTGKENNLVSLLIRLESVEDVERLGRPYEQAGDAGQRSMGTGLGLSLVRAFAELHGGTMEIESQQGEGTAVTVRLPVGISDANGERPHGAEVIPLNVGR